MSAPFAGDIRMFGGTFAPRNYAFADGSAIPISQNNMIFALFGTTYGGDGRTTVGLPDLRGRTPIHYGHGSGLTDVRIGQQDGFEDVTLTSNEVPSHTHSLQGDDVTGAGTNPVDNVLGEFVGANPYSSLAPDVDMASEAIASAGGGQGHNNMQPFLTIHFIVALQGVFPSQS